MPTRVLDRAAFGNRYTFYAQWTVKLCKLWIMYDLVSGDLAS